MKNNSTKRVQASLNAVPLAEYDTPACSHNMQEIYVSLLSSQARCNWLEAHCFPIDEYMTPPLVVDDFRVVAPDQSGTGVEFDYTKLNLHRVAS